MILYVPEHCLKTAMVFIQREELNVRWYFKVGVPGAELLVSEDDLELIKLAM